MPNADCSQQFEYENGFYLTAPIDRVSKFITHLDLFRCISGLAGDIVECGVFKGASLCRWIKFRALLENPFSRRIVAFDTFGDFPDADFEPDQAPRARLLNAAGNRSIARADLESLLQRLGLNTNLDLIAGDILQSVPAYVRERPELKIALLNIDVDMLAPTRTCLEHLYPSLVRGGVAILDDYGAFPGANKAIDEFFAGTNVTIRKLPYTCNVAYVVKE
jgi:Macrocin-O-methyltransferase (TylF)